MITLYDKLETDFQYNGLGSLDNSIIDPKIKWIDNGLFSLEFEYPLFAKHGLEIENSSIIKASDPEMDNLFFVYKIIPSMGYMKVYCYQVFYKLAFNSINDTNVVSKNGQGALTQLSGATQYSHKFKFTSDISKVANSRIVRKNPVEILLDSNLDNSFVNRWGGHIVRHGFNISMNQAYGSNKGYSIRHKKDLIGYEATLDETSVVTRIRPVGYDGLLLPEIYVDSPLIDHYPEPRIQEYEYSDVKVGDGEGEFATKESGYVELRRLASLEYSSTKVDVPQGVYKIDFVNLKDTEEYKNFAPLKQILPGDIVTVTHEEDGINITAQMVEYEWNPLSKSYSSITLGNYEKTFTSTVSKVDKIQNDLKEINNQMTLVYTAANGKNQVFVGSTEPNIDQNSAEGDLWFKKNGDKTELWILRKVNSELQWVVEISDATQEELRAEIKSILAQADVDRQIAEQNFEQAVTDAKQYTELKAQEFDNQMIIVNQDLVIAKQSADTAVTKANQAVVDAGFAKVDAAAATQLFYDMSPRIETAFNNANLALGDAGEAYWNAEQALNKAATLETTTGNLTTNYNALTQIVSLKADTAKVNTIKGTVDKHTLDISTNATAVGLKADKTLVDTINQTVSKHTLDIKAAADGLTLKADASLVNTIKGTVDQHSLDLTAQSGQIAARLTSAQVNTLVAGKGYATTNQLTATSSSLTTLITGVETDLANLEIGGRNLIIRKDERKNTVLGTNGEPGTGAGSLPKEKIKVTPGESLMFSKNTTGDNYWRIHWYDTNGIFMDRLPTTTNKFNWTVPANVHYVWASYPDDAEVKIERGNKATDWTPAPEDMTTKAEFTEVSQTVNTWGVRVGNSEGKISALEIKANGLQTTVADKADQTQVTQLSNQWTQTTNLVNGHTTQISSLGNQIDLRLTSTQVNSAVTAAILSDKTIKDTRNDNMNPAWYFNNYGLQTVAEFKYRNILGVPGSQTYVHLTTEVPWKDSSGGNIIQTAKSSDGTYQRVGSTTFWSSWEKIVESGEVLAQINLSSEGILIQGKRIQLDGDVAMNAAFITRLNTQTLTAVTANIATIRGQILIANAVTATHIKAENALIDNIFATTALIERLTSKAAFIADIKAIDIAADRITTGTLNAAKVTIINLDASRIVSGTMQSITIRGSVIYASEFRQDDTSSSTNTLVQILKTGAWFSDVTGSKTVNIDRAGIVLGGTSTVGSQTRITNNEIYLQNMYTHNITTTGAAVFEYVTFNQQPTFLNGLRFGGSSTPPGNARTLWFGTIGGATGLWCRQFDSSTVWKRFAFVEEL